MDKKDTGILFVRGVGEGAKDENLVALTPVLEDYDLDPVRAREVNWSWTDFVAWPYLKRSPGIQKTETTLIPRAEFLRLLGFSVLNTAAEGLPSRSRWAKGLRFAIDLALLPSQLIPIFIVSVPILLVLHLITARSAFAAFGITLLPLPIAAISFESGLIRATFRAIILRALWPALFPVSLALSYGWVPVLFAGFVLGIVAAVSYLVPEPWRYSLYSLSGKYDPNTFEDSRLFTVIKVFGAVVGSGFAAGLIGTMLNFLSQRFGFLFKVSADIFRYLGDSSYRANIQNEFARQVNELQQLGTKNLLVFAHSLGTVIAVDSLRRVPPRGLKSIVLVTAGSPLRRFFWRFFECEYGVPMEILLEATDALCETGSTFAWFNVYRRKDPVGGCLKLPPDHECAVPKPNETILNAHLDYWTDKEVHREIARLLK